MYVVLTGAKKNIGDFLITDRCKQLLREFRPEHELIQLPSWESLDTHLDQINSSSAVIIMGGPGFQESFYPGVYKLSSNPSDIRVPIIPMGLGWKGFPGDRATLINFRFQRESEALLKRMSEEAVYLGCRDYMTRELLIRSQISNALMTGCPVWYSLDSIGKSLIPPTSVDKIAFTPAQRSIYQEQSLSMMKMLRELFPKARLYCSFNRGIAADKYTSASSERVNSVIKDEAMRLNFEVVDNSYDLKKIRYYDDCQLHVGYRLHSHLYFLSKRRPSFLLHEDGRGRGLSETINIRGVDAYDSSLVSRVFARVNRPGLPPSAKEVLAFVKPRGDAVSLMKAYIEEELDSGFCRFAGLPAVIDAYFEVMKKFIESLPE